MIRWILIVALFLVGCQKSDVSNEQTLKINIGEDPQTLDPRKARDLKSITLVNMFFEGLMRTSKKGDVEMALADRVEISDDRLQYRFHLQKSFWSNGDPVSSFDFAESWRSILDPKFPTDIAYQLYGIKNAQKAKLGEVNLSELGIFTPDPETLIVELEHPIPYFLELVSMSPFFPTPQMHLSKNPDWAFNASTFVCNGPFKLETWKSSDFITAIKNQNYWQNEDVKLSRIDLFMMGEDTEIQMFEEKNLDWAGSPLSTIPVDAVRNLRENNKCYINPFLATYFLRVNTADLIDGRKNPLSLPTFRKALSFAIDRTAITEHILQGGQIPATALVPPALGLSERGYFQDNRVKAQELLSDALLTLDLTRDTLGPIRISFGSSARNASIVQAIQKQLEETLGIKVELEAVELKTYFQRVSNKEYQIATSSWTADFSDPINFLEVFKFKDASTNNTNWESSKYIDLLNRSAFSKSTIERNETLRDAETVLMDQMPIIPIFHFALNYLKRDGLEEVALSPLGKIDFRWARIEEATNY